MVKKIINWTAGGFFRSLGRVLMYVIIGLLISILLNKSGFNLPRFLQFDVVNASELQNWAVSESRIWWDDHGTLGGSSWETTPHTWSPTLPVTRLQFRLKASSGLSMENSYTFQFGYLPNPDAINVSDMLFFNANSESEDYSCGQWSLNNNGYHLIKCSFTPHVDYSSNDWLYVMVYFNQSYLTSIRSYMFGFDERLGTNAVITESTTNIINNNNANTQAVINNITNATNSINNGLNALTDSQKVCETITTSYSSLSNQGYIGTNGVPVNGNQYFRYSDYISINNDTIITIETIANTYSTNIAFYDSNKTFISKIDTLNVSGNITIPNNAKYLRYDIYSGNKPIMNIKTCKNGNQAITDTLTDDNVDSESNDMADFINDFELETDGTISQILTIPIDFISEVFLEDSTDDLCFTLKGVQSCLPNGKRVLWNKDFSGVHENSLVDPSNTTRDAFITLFNLVVGGFICYKLLIGLARTIERALQPADTYVEVMKL